MVNVANPAIQTFGKYQILERIATGGMAEIYKARLEGIGGFQRTFAIKRILPNLSQNSEYIAMLVDEAKVAGLLSHANIVQILDLGQVDMIWYIAMEYVHGRDLGAVLRRAKKKGLCLPVPHTVFIAIELLKGLEYAHQRQVMRGGRPVALNIIHRDVSPPNVLLSFQGEVKLTDFGIARASHKAMETVSGIVKGRFDYMSPEQAAGAKDLDQRSDLFSVGVVLYEMLTGHHPFRTDNEIGTIERVRTGRYVPVSQRNPEVPFTLETIVDRALQVNRDDRYPSATAFKEALDKFFHDAGFIFTHATLASYVRGLFPEATARPKPASAPPSATTSSSGKHNRPAVDPAEGPTRRLDRKKLKTDATPANGMSVADPSDPEIDAARSSRLAELLQGDDSDAALRRTPDAGWDDEPATQLRQGFDELNTIIRKGELADEPSASRSDGRGAKSSGERSGPGERSSSGAERSDRSLDRERGQTPPTAAVSHGSLSGSLPPNGAAGAPTPGTSFGAPTPGPSVGGASTVSAGATGFTGVNMGRRTNAGTGTGAGARRKGPRSVSGIVGWMVSPVALVVGLLGGALLTSLAAGLVASYGYGGPPPPPPHSPTIEVIAPIGTQILLDGEAVAKEFPVEPDRLHHLEVTIKGYAPFTADLKLGMGESMVYMINAVDVKPAP